ncbi:MAG: NADP-dependent malic enzyme [Thermoleophilia bacterium]
MSDQEHQPTVEELIAKAYQPMEDAMKLHPFYKGKIETTLKCCVRDFQDFGIWYTPGVSKPCLDIKDDPEKVYEHTNKGNTVAVISDGTRVLGMGDIGPKAGLPVMEGKSLLYKYLGGVDGFPLMVDTKDPDKLIEFVKLVQPGLGGINLEDISQPKCFRILDTLRAECEIPVWHDDQQGTACVTLAGLINALKVTGKKIDEISIAFIGSGAANVAISRLIFAFGADPAKCRIVDSKGILHKGRSDIEAVKAEWVDKWKYCQITNAEQRTGNIADALRGADVCIALSKQGPGTIEKDWVKAMAPDSIVFLCANPIPEMWPWEAKEAGAAVVATGRSDFPNQVNNSIGFPGIFRGQNINQVFQGHKACIILVELQHNFGHWICVIDHGTYLEHFDSYGIPVDGELKWVPMHFREENHELRPHLTYLLETGDKPIKHNSYHLQRKSEKYATCGRFVCCRINNKNLSIDQFAEALYERGEPDEVVTELTTKY